MNQPVKAASALMQARLSGQRIPAIPTDCAPANFADAYAIQVAHIEQLLAHEEGRQAGYKIACTNEAAQEALGVDGPFRGPMFSQRIYASPARLNTADFFMCVIEPEFGFEMGQDLPPREKPYSEKEVAQAVAALIPAIEVVDSRYEDWTTIGALSLIADLAVHGVWVPGTRQPDWSALNLARFEVWLWVNGRLNQTGRGSAVLGHPLTALTWLANHLRESGIGLKAGEFVTSGVVIDALYYAQPGDIVRADFGALGSVGITFE